MRGLMLGLDWRQSRRQSGNALKILTFELSEVELGMNPRWYS